MSGDADARLQQWQQNRAARLAQLPWLQTTDSGGRPVRYAKNEILVRTEHADAARTVLLGQGNAAAQITTDEGSGSFVRMTAPGIDVAAAVHQLNESAGATVAGPNHVFVSTGEEGITSGGPYGPPALADAYNLAGGPAPDASVRVVVVDTGVWRDSPLPQDWYDAAPHDYTPDDGTSHADTGHANFITGVIMAHTSDAKVRIVEVLDADGTCREHKLARALSRLAGEGVDVVNLSLGGYTDDDLPPVVLTEALTALLGGGADRAVVAAAGNDGDHTRPHWPAAYANYDVPFAAQVVAVGAHDGTQVCSWSNLGDWIRVVAPGSDIISTYVNHADFPGGFATWSGTSFSAPYVVAAIASAHRESGSVTAAVHSVLDVAAKQELGGYPALV